jgi:hypothetical protein
VASSAKAKLRFSTLALSGESRDETLPSGTQHAGQGANRIAEPAFGRAPQFLGTTLTSRDGLALGRHFLASRNNDEYDYHEQNAGDNTNRSRIHRSNSSLELCKRRLAKACAAYNRTELKEQQKKRARTGEEDGQDQREQALTLPILQS